MMRSTLLLFVSLVTTPAVASPSCCGGGDGSLDQILIEMLKKDFLVPHQPVGQPTAYVITADGERLWLDSTLWTGARRMAATFEAAPAQVDPLPTATVTDAETFSFKPWIKALVKRARGLTLEITATFMDMFYRFGLTAGALMFTAESIEHFFLPPTAVPLCKFVHAGCVLVSRDAQDLGRALFKSFPGVESRRERLRLLRLSWTLRRQRRQALRQVFHADGRDVEVGTPPNTLGAAVLADSCFKSALATPDTAGIACTEDHATGLRYGGFGRAKPAARPRAEALGPPDLNAVYRADPVERAWTARDLIEFLELKLNFMQVQASGVRDFDARAFYRLRRRLTEMRRALDYYAYTITIRAGLARPRTEDEAQVDRQFTATVKEFMIEFDRSVQMARAGLGREPHPFAAFKTAPKKALALVKNWLKRAPGSTVGCETDF